MSDPLDKVFNDLYNQVVGEPYKPRMDRTWEERNGRIRSVTLAPEAKPESEPSKERLDTP